MLIIRMSPLLASSATKIFPEEPPVTPFGDPTIGNRHNSCCIESTSSNSTKRSERTSAIIIGICTAASNSCDDPSCAVNSPKPVNICINNIKIVCPTTDFFWIIQSCGKSWTGITIGSGRRSTCGSGPCITINSTICQDPSNILIVAS